jgi:uncharacterized protein (DUF4415 family)
MKKQYNFAKAHRGPILPAPTGKTRITIRIDDDILDWFRAQADQAGGASYQTMINDALRRVMEGRAESVEAALRRVIREEFPKLRKASSS